MTDINLIELQDGDILDFSKLLPLPKDTFTLKITDKINNLTLTSNNITCNINILIEARNDDLTINVYDLSINSLNKNAIDFTAGDFCNYKSYIVYSGTNFISSNKLPICITNNQTVEFKATSNGSISIASLSYYPALGNMPECAGNAHIIFSGIGTALISACTQILQAPIMFNTTETWPLSGICICHKKTDEISSIFIKDQINVKIIGGTNLYHSLLSSPPNNDILGGAAINVDYFCFIEKNSDGVLELVGGIGNSIGPCIYLAGGFIKLLAPCTLSSTLNNDLKQSANIIFNSSSTAAIMLIAKPNINDEQISKFILMNNIVIHAEHLLSTNTKNFSFLNNNHLSSDNVPLRNQINYIATKNSSKTKLISAKPQHFLNKASFLDSLIKLFNNILPK